MRIVILGSGGSWPTPLRNVSSIGVKRGPEVILFDCGEGTQRQLMKTKLSFMKLKHIFITHWHADHWLGLIGLMMTMGLEGRTEPLYIHAPEAERFVSDILDLGYWGPRFRVIPKDVPYDGKEVITILKAKEYEILSIPVRHSVPAVCYAFKEKDAINVDMKKAETVYGLKQSPVVGKLKKEGKVTYKGKAIKLEDIAIVKKGVKAVYSGDTKPCRNMEIISEGANLLIHEATFEEEKESRMHAGAKEAGQLAKKANVGELILTHFSRRYVDVSPLVKEAKKHFPKTMAARDYMKVTLKRKEK
ncbi:MAG: ribonuclease Z [Thermoplasmata archaeon]|nr:ribonuclease Z [Thermoplasmata archaeon]